MKSITLVTGNTHKVVELQAIFPPSLNLTAHKLDLDEIQSLDLHAIVSHKAKQAYEILGSPVIVEDVSAELEKLNGLPGPFVKFFEERLGKGALYKLAGEGRAKIACTMAYFDGEHQYIVDGVVEGSVVAPREGEGFGFDFVFVPEGYDQTLSELGLGIKNKVSHRAKAAQALVSALCENNSLFRGNMLE